MGQAAERRRDYVTVEELRKIYPYSKALIYREIRTGRIPHIRLAGRIAINVREFEQATRRAAERYVGQDL